METSEILFIVLIIVAIIRTIFNRIIYNKINPTTKFWMIWDIAKKGGAGAYGVIIFTLWWYSDKNDNQQIRNI
ncbi:MAG: hypothetical protein ACR2GN_05895 [Bacteroidia bacterium]